MLRIRILLVLLFVFASFLVVLARPLPGRAAKGDPLALPPPDPANADPIVPPLPAVEAGPVRKPAAVKRARVSLGSRVASYAKHLLGVPYVYGGTTPRGFDCSGLTSFVYRHFGISISRTSFAQFGNGVRVARGALQPGDLVFFDRLGHVGIYIGGGRFIHSPRPGSRVRVDSLTGWYAGDYDGARRLVRSGA